MKYGNYYESIEGYHLVVYVSSKEWWVGWSNGATRIRVMRHQVVHDDDIWDWEMGVASAVVGRASGGTYSFKTRSAAVSAAKSAVAELLAGIGKPLPVWAIRAKREGWKPPKGWKP